MCIKSYGFETWIDGVIPTRFLSHFLLSLENKRNIPTSVDIIGGNMIRIAFVVNTYIRKVPDDESR